MSRLAGGRAQVRGGPDRGLSLADLARAVHFRSSELGGLEPSLEATAHFANPAPWTFTNGAHLAMVEVDGDTGAVRVLSYVAVDDCGRVVNPALVDGQIAGGVAQGIGGALGEWSVHDDAGQLVTASLMEYPLPTAADLPFIAVHHLETPAPSIPGGFKGAGEAGTTGAPAAVLNAVNDALAPLGAEVGDLPLTPERVWRALSAGPGAGVALTAARARRPGPLRAWRRFGHIMNGVRVHDAGGAAGRPRSCRWLRDGAPRAGIRAAERSANWASGPLAPGGRHMLEFHGETDVGKRRQLNEDAIYAQDGLFVVCDGMGGHKAGEVASKLATETIAGFIERSAEDPEMTWPFGFDPTLSYDGTASSPRSSSPTASCSARRSSVDEYAGMGTTVAAMLCSPGRPRMTYAHVGDSRIYLIRDGAMPQLTRDDTWANLAWSDRRRGYRAGDEEHPHQGPRRPGGRRVRHGRPTARERRHRPALLRRADQHASR